MGSEMAPVPVSGTLNGTNGHEQAGRGEEVAARGQSAWSSAFTLANAAIGVGVLSFPYAYSLTGLLGGCLLSLLVAWLEHFTLCTLVQAADHYGVYSYQAVVHKAFGRAGGRAGALLLSCAMVVYLYGSLVAYLILLGDVSTSLVVAFIGDGSFWAQRWVGMVLPGVFVCLPLCLTRSLGALAAVSSLAVVALLYTTCAIMFLGTQQISAHPETIWEAKLFSLSSSSMKALPMLVFAFQCHATVVQIFSEMEESPSLARLCGARKDCQAADRSEATVLSEPLLQPVHHRPGKKLRGMYSVITVALLECLVGYCLVGTFGYLAYPKDVESNVLNSFPHGEVIIQVARAMMGVTGVVSYPINLFPCRQAIDHLLATAVGLPPAVQASKARHLSMTALLFFASLAVALVVTDLGSVFQVVGGTAGSIMIFILPGLVAIQLRQDAHADSQPLAFGESQEVQGREEDMMERKPFKFKGSMTPGFLVLLFGVVLLVDTVLESAGLITS